MSLISKPEVIKVALGAAAALGLAYCLYNVDKLPFIRGLYTRNQEGETVAVQIGPEPPLQPQQQQSRFMSRNIDYTRNDTNSTSNFEANFDGDVTELPKTGDVLADRMTIGGTGVGSVINANMNINGKRDATG